MEVFGTVVSAVTLASAFSSCIHAFEVFYVAKDGKAELRTLQLQFKLQEARLWTWGKELGWVSEPDSRTRPSIGEEVSGVVAQTLQHLFELMTDAEALRKEYGCRSVDDLSESQALIDDGAEPSGRLKAGFDRFRVQIKAHSIISESILTWIVRDQKRFRRLIEGLRDIISDLRDVTSPFLPLRKQDDTANYHLNRIDDVTNLETVAEAAEDDWPELSEAASM